MRIFLLIRIDNRHLEKMKKNYFDITTVILLPRERQELKSVFDYKLIIKISSISLKTIFIFCTQL